MPSIKRKYKCEGCGLVFNRFQAITTKDDYHIFYADSLEYHLSTSELCNEVARRERKLNRAARREQESYEMFDY